MFQLSGVYSSMPPLKPQLSTVSVQLCCGYKMQLMTSLALKIIQINIHPEDGTGVLTHVWLATSWLYFNSSQAFY
jgi:hypothetical protein